MFHSLLILFQRNQKENLHPHSHFLPSAPPENCQKRGYRLSEVCFSVMESLFLSRGMVSVTLILRQNRTKFLFRRRKTHKVTDRKIQPIFFFPD